eukprot:TRINITY_DN13818_c0_g1_i3.p1 TRINITY_DN13818_c0_g1~~TRINITY_DN13818_c0_g1_i3.p1  ORF type:complete len:113 (+),score=12.51 TRINITY_DN13818_c0_g1_i3:116-454(+)
MKNVTVFLGIASFLVLISFSVFCDSARVLMSVDDRFSPKNVGHITGTHGGSSSGVSPSGFKTSRPRGARIPESPSMGLRKKIIPTTKASSISTENFPSPPFERMGHSPGQMP